MAVVVAVEGVATRPKYSFFTGAKPLELVPRNRTELLGVDIVLRRALTSQLRSEISLSYD